VVRLAALARREGLVLSDDQLAAISARLEQLLDELRELVAAPALQRVEDALRAVVDIYAAGLGRAIDHARASGASADRLDPLLAADELLASLLLLHGLHPWSTEERVHRALAALGSELGEDVLELVEIRDGVAHLAARAPLAAGAMSPSLAESIVRRVVETSAPELSSISITGLAPQRDPTLVQIRTVRPAP
jgi:hypothetical protein